LAAMFCVVCVQFRFIRAVYVFCK